MLGPAEDQFGLLLKLDLPQGSQTATPLTSQCGPYRDALIKYLLHHCTLYTYFKCS